MKISMLLPTLNRRDLMIRAVDSILTQSYQNFEIIIVDQSDKHYSDVMKKDNRITYIHILEKGLSHARNIGLEYVTGEIVGLMDDDAVYTDNVLELVNKRFESDEKVGLVSGVVVDPQNMIVSLRGMQKKETLITKKNIFQCCISPSMFLKADILKAEKFDEEFGIGSYWGSAEETDIALKYIYAKRITVFDPNVVVEHRGDDKKSIAYSKLQNYSRGFGAVCCKHTKMYGNKVILYLFVRAIIRAIGGWGISLVSFNQHMLKYYRISVVSKWQGYRTYNKQHGL